MYKRILVDNCIIAYIKDISFHRSNKVQKDLLLEKTSLIFLSNIKTIGLEFLLSEESLGEIEKLKSGQKKDELQTVYYAFKKNKPVIKNRSITYNDATTRYDSPDVYYDHLYNNGDLNRITSFFKKKGNKSDFDPKYITYSMLPENKIDVFLTTDEGIWNYRNEIKKLFDVLVMKPSELAEYYKLIT